MEQIDVDLNAFTLRCRSVAVSHYAHGLRRGLDPGEPVVLRDPGTGAHFTAVVADVDFGPGDTDYRIEVGARICAAEAADWLAPEDDATCRHTTTREIMELLGELRRSRRQARELADDLAR